MNLTAWVPVIAPVATVIVAAIAAIPAYRQLRYKAREEVRLTKASRAEVDVRLLDTFIAIMGKAHARGGYVLADSALQGIIAGSGPLAPKSPEDLTRLIQSAMVVYPVGAAEQNGAVAALAELGVQYETLRVPALAFLENLATWNPAPGGVEEALARLKDKSQWKY